MYYMITFQNYDISLFYNPIYSYFSYCNIVMGQYLQHRRYKYFTLQKCFVRMATFFWTTLQLCNFIPKT